MHPFESRRSQRPFCRSAFRIGVVGLLYAVIGTTAAAQPANLPISIPYSIPPKVYSSLTFGDLEGDGDLDLAISGINANGVYSLQVYQLVDVELILSASQEEPYIIKEFEPLNIQSPGIAYGDIKLADYDLDGDLDLLMTGLVDYVQGRETIREPVLRVHQNLWPPERDFGGWRSPFVWLFDLPGYYQSAADWGDFDGDGDPDIIVAGLPWVGAVQAVTRIYRNDRTSFSEIDPGLPGVKFGDLAWGDYDGDGDPDLAMMGDAGEGAYITRVFRNDAGAFTDIGLEAPGLAHGSIEWGDYDNDGDLDLLVNGMRLDPRFMVGVVRIYRNDGGVLVDAGYELEGLGNGEAAWGDVDRDGDLDLFVVGTPDALGASFLHMYALTESGYERTWSLGGQRFAALAAGDYNGDGDADVIFTGEVGNNANLQFLMNWDYPECAIKWIEEGYPGEC